MKAGILSRRGMLVLVALVTARGLAFPQSTNPKIDEALVDSPIVFDNAGCAKDFIRSQELGEVAKRKAIADLFAVQCAKRHRGFYRIAYIPSDVITIDTKSIIHGPMMIDVKTMKAKGYSDFTINSVAEFADTEDVYLIAGQPYINLVPSAYIVLDFVPSRSSQPRRAKSK